MRSAQTWLIVLLVTLTASLLWFPPLASSLWVDELDTFFSAKDGVVTAVERTLAVHPQCSTLYNVFIALVIQWIGQSESTLRAPSVIATVVAALYLFRIGTRLVDRETGLLAVLVFVALGDVAFAAADARSYAFATAACTAATFYLLELLALPAHAPTSVSPVTPAERRRAALLYGLTAALTFHFHFLFVLALLPHALLVAYLGLRGGLTATRREILTAVGVAMLVALPAAEPLLSTIEARYALAYAQPPWLGGLLAVWVRPEIVASMLPLALLAVGLRVVTRLELPPLAAELWGLLVAWAVVPPLVIYAVSELSSVSMFLPRYYMSAAPALALIVGITLRGLDPPALRIGCAIAYSLLSVLVYSRDVHVAEDWRGVAASVNEVVEESTPILLDSGFTEGARVEWLRQRVRDERRGLLAAPTFYYPLNGDVIPLPYQLTEETAAYLEYVIVPALADVDRFVCIGRGKASSWWRPWFDARYAAAGYTARALHRSPLLNAVVYERNTR